MAAVAARLPPLQPHGLNRGLSLLGTDGESRTDHRGAGRHPTRGIESPRGLASTSAVAAVAISTTMMPTNATAVGSQWRGVLDPSKELLCWTTWDSSNLCSTHTCSADVPTNKGGVMIHYIHL